MSDRIEEQITRGLQLLADEVELPVRSRRAARPSRRVLVVAFAVVAVSAAAVALGVRGTSSTFSTAPQKPSPFLRDRFNYHSAPLTFVRNNGFAGFMPAVASADALRAGIFVQVGGPYNVPYVSDIAASSQTNAWIVGSYWGSPAGVAWHWDGQEWGAVAMPGNPKAVTTIADGEAWAVGSGAIAHWDGTQWVATSLWQRQAPDLVSVFRERARQRVGRGRNSRARESSRRASVGRSVLEDRLRAMGDAFWRRPEGGHDRADRRLGRHRKTDRALGRPELDTNSFAVRAG